MIRDPILIIGCPRSGTTLLYNILSEVPSLWSIGYESKAIIERFHHPSTRNWESGALGVDDLTPESGDFILSAFDVSAAPGAFWRGVNHLRRFLRSNPFWRQVKHHGRRQATGAALSSALPQAGLDMVRRLIPLIKRLGWFGNNKAIRLLEKTPENCLRLPFMLALFPDARVIYLIRDGRANVSSLIEGWRHPHLFTSYQTPEPLRIPGIQRAGWAFTLIPGWRDLLDQPLEVVCSWQWIRCNEAVLAHQGENRGQVPYLTVRYEDLVLNPAKELARIGDFTGIDVERDLGQYLHRLPEINVVSAPELEKWRRLPPDILDRAERLIHPMMERLGYLGIQ